jgi:hypothetical protein
VDRLLVVTVPPATDVPALAAKLARLPEVEYAEPVPLYRTCTSPTRPLAVPDDAAYAGGQQAYLAGLEVEAAWDVQKCETGTPRPIVCIVDGGTNWQHEDLGASLWTNPGETAGNGIDDDGNGYVDDLHGWNFRNGNGDPRGDPATAGNANHGTHTAGLAAAVTDNATGVASASWNPLLMAVNASGTNDGTIAYGYEGVVYAAENGADIASLSWGGTGGSLAMQDIVDFATSMGTLVVAAAGNNNAREPFYPAAYRNVIAVANVQNNDVRYGGPSGSNYGGWLDVAAPGTSLYSTFDMGSTNAYGSATGTSMACPVAAAVAALVKARHPTWGPLQVGEQLRVTCDDINAVNPSYVDLLGKGRVNARRAVSESSPGVRITSWTCADAGGDGQLNQGETILVSLVVHNYLAPAVGPTYTLSATSPWVTVTDGAQAGTTLLEGEEATLAGAFSFTVHPSAPPGTALDLRLDIAALGYTDFQFVPIVLEPLFETHDVNRLRVSLTGTGGIGWIGWPSGLGSEGLGFAFDGGPNLLFEGALLLGTGPDRLSDAARTGGEHTDFAPVGSVPPVKSTPGARAAQEITAAYTESINGTTPLGVRVDLASWASDVPPYDDFVVVGFEITNRAAVALDSLWAGLFFDWDIDEAHYTTNRTAWDAARRLGYAWDSSPGLPYVGVVALSGTEVGFSAIPNDGSGAPWGLNDGFTKAEKWDLLQRGTGTTSAGPADISNALASGPYLVPAGASATAFFALLAAPDLAGLQASADRARQWFADSLATEAADPLGTPRLAVIALGRPVPNPFNPAVRFDLVTHTARAIDAGLYDVHGRRVATLAAATFAPGRHGLYWDGRDATGRPAGSGVYLLRLRSGGVVLTRRAVLVR